MSLIDVFVESYVTWFHLLRQHQGLYTECNTILLWTAVLPNYNQMAHSVSVYHVEAVYRVNQATHFVSAPPLLHVSRPCMLCSRVDERRCVHVCMYMCVKEVGVYDWYPILKVSDVRGGGANICSSMQHQDSCRFSKQSPTCWLLFACLHSAT